MHNIALHYISSTLNKKHFSIWVQSKSVLILQITACKKMPNIHCIDSTQHFFFMNVCQLLLLMMFCYVVCDNLCFSENKILTAGRFHMFHSMLQIYICLSFFDLVFKVVLFVKVNFAFYVGIRIAVLCLCCT